MYRVISNNSNDSNHKKIVEKLTSQSEELVIASPYLMENFDSFFKNIDLEKLNTIKLISTLEPNSYNQLKKIKSLKSFAQSKILKQNKVDVQISINNKLHGKIYVFNIKKEKKVIITSANFTNSGLDRNHEWGILTSDTNIISSISKQLWSTIQFINLTLSEIEHLENKCEEYFKDKNTPSKSDVKLDLTEFLPNRFSDTILAKNVTYWLKPVGTREYPIEKGHVFDKETPLNFANKKNKPKVQVNDILLVYGVGTGKIVSIYRVIKPPTLADDEIQHKQTGTSGRWPWYVIGENITNQYRNSWWTYDLRLVQLEKDFLAESVDNKLSSRNPKSLMPAIQRQKDRVKISKDFCQFVYDKIKALK